METFRESQLIEGVLVGTEGTLKYVENDAIINQTPHPKGYKQCSIYGKVWLVHRLIAFTYPEICGEYFEGAEVDHLDTVRDNNAATNLRWVSRTNNHLNPITRQRMSEAQKGKKPVNQRAIESTGKVMDIFLYEYESIQGASRELTGKPKTISTQIQRCCDGVGHRCLGRRWRYKE